MSFLARLLAPSTFNTNNYMQERKSRTVRQSSVTYSWLRRRRTLHWGPSSLRLIGLRVDKYSLMLRRISRVTIAASHQSCNHASISKLMELKLHLSWKLRKLENPASLPRKLFACESSVAGQPLGNRATLARSTHNWYRFWEAIKREGFSVIIYILNPQKRCQVYWANINRSFLMKEDIIYASLGRWTAIALRHALEINIKIVFHNTLHDRSCSTL